MLKANSDDSDTSDYFGYSVSINGNYAIIGAPLENSNDIEQAGSAYIYKLDDSDNWVQIAKIIAGDA